MLLYSPPALITFSGVKRRNTTPDSLQALELFVESLLTKAVEITSARSAKTLSPAHLKQCILAENRFDFLKDLVVSIPDYQGEGEEGIVATVPSASPMLHPPICRSNSTSESLTGSSSVSKRTGGTPRPRGRPRKNASVPPSNPNVQRLWASASRKSATESDESDSGESEGSEEDEDMSTDTDSLPKPRVKNAAAVAAVGEAANGVSTEPSVNSESTIQFNAVQPNFYQEINSTQPHLQIQITLPSNDAQKPETNADDDDYDT
uniref:EOG090X0H1B n=1 Tax=Evadne anonyx TaxID=141404 RepID=A0A9N6WQN3_9CRUS|nr:EOG090X0H1B [Evadne anonyx]